MIEQIPGRGMVSFVGAGPGDPELLTIKGRDAIAAAALVLYAGSLVPEALLDYAAPWARKVNSAPLTLEECHALMRETALAGKAVARLHTGDASLYGALREQAALLDRDGIPWRVIPGITAACAAAAAAGVTFTVPEVTQTLVITRMPGRTPMPAGERLRALASHGPSLAVYLSSQLVEEMRAELLQSLPPETPVICAYRVGWPQQRIHRTTLSEVSRCVRENNLHRQTVFLILPGLNASGAPSRLYDAGFSHGWREAGESAPPHDASEGVQPIKE